VTVINRDLVSHHANGLLYLLGNDETSPLTPAGDVVVSGPPMEKTLQGRFPAVDSDGVAWVVTVAPALIQDKAQT
jgi:hypothetical protein